MPNVVLEAMATGLPVVATKVEGVAELLGDATSSQAVAFGDSTALAERIIQIAGNPSLAASLGERNRYRAVSSFAIDQMVGQYAQLYESIARGQGKI
jgi:glycosyltransferase involved in cell wall biosynthesis